ncbi:hypothetical protein LKO27_06065 [Tessaracoccus sp. OS52]|uniref:hypothetical protein n=1 Tax=Tessaracoccus sp. OS52 TaxID=2886691 RepID=UPI001D1082DA|nr:hypothetical protein [Tessaracoccus sp. OS52]MCC2592977.1 hypothetical protein [Tessaracoccus sp. OS52]
MNDIKDRLADVGSDDLPPIPLAVVRRRASRQRAGQRLAAGAGLVVLLGALALGVPRLLPEGLDVADAPASSNPAATTAPGTPEATSLADEPPGTLAVWQLADPAAVTAETTRLDLLVTRVECASAFTGEVLPPQVTITDEAVSIRAEVQWIDPNQAAECPSNPYVPLTVALPEPLGARMLVDEGCANGEFARTSHCEDDGVRWLP